MASYYYQPVKESDETDSCGEETNQEPSGEIGGEHKEEVNVDSVVKEEVAEECKEGGAVGGSTSAPLDANRSCEELDAENDETFATKNSKTASSLLESYEVVEEDGQIEPALKKLRELGEGLPLLAVDLEGEKLGRKGELVIVSVATEKQTYLFNIQKLGAGVFDKGLRDLLQDPGRQKLMFDCRQDSDCLWYQFRVKLTNVLDLQLMEVIYRGDALTHQLLNLRTNGRIVDVPRVLGLGTCLENYVKDEDLIDAKKEVRHLDGEWLTQPLRRSLLRYAAGDVISMIRLYRVLWDKFEEMDAMEQLLDASNKYLDFYRLKGNRSYDMFEGNPFLPWRIFQGTYNKEVKCVGCKRDFPGSDFSKNQKQNMVPKCPVCKKVKNVEDVRQNREDNWSRRCYDDEVYDSDDYPYYCYDDSDDYSYYRYDDSDDDCYASDDCCIM